MSQSVPVFGMRLQRKSCQWPTFTVTSSATPTLTSAQYFPIAVTLHIPMLNMVTVITAATSNCILTSTTTSHPNSSFSIPMLSTLVFLSCHPASSCVYHMFFSIHVLHPMRQG